MSQVFLWRTLPAFSQCSSLITAFLRFGAPHPDSLKHIVRPYRLSNLQELGLFVCGQYYHQLLDVFTLPSVTKLIIDKVGGQMTMSPDLIPTSMSPNKRSGLRLVEVRLKLTPTMGRSRCLCRSFYVIYPLWKKIEFKVPNEISTCATDDKARRSICSPSASMLPLRWV